MERLCLTVSLTHRNKKPSLNGHFVSFALLLLVLLLPLDADTAVAAAADAAWLELLTLERQLVSSYFAVSFFFFFFFLLHLLLLGMYLRIFFSLSLTIQQSRTRCKWPSWYNHQPPTSSFFFFVSVSFPSGPRHYFLLHYHIDTINWFSST